MFDGEHGLALHAMQVNRASSRGVGKFSVFFSSCSGNLGYVPELRRRWPFKTRVYSATSALLLSSQGKLEILLEAWQGNTDAFQGDTGDPVSISSFHRAIGIPNNFQEDAGIVSF